VVWRSGRIPRDEQGVCDHLERAGAAAEIVAVEYEFQRAEDHAGNRMLRVRRRAVGRLGPENTEAAEAMTWRG
jgi:hypothetical protein